MQKLKNRLAVLTALAITAHGSTTAAIGNGKPDGDLHPFVGLMVAQDVKGTPLWRCSGALIAPRVFLTSGHCTEQPAIRAEAELLVELAMGRRTNEIAEQRGVSTDTIQTQLKSIYMKTDTGGQSELAALAARLAGTFPA